MINFIVGAPTLFGIVIGVLLGIGASAVYLNYIPKKK